MTGAHATSGAATYRVLRELGARAEHTYAAIHDPHELVVAQRFVRAKTSAETLAILMRDARCLAKNWHPNIARVRHVDLIDADLVVATELVDGVTLKDFFNTAASARKTAADPLVALPILVRILLDVLGGLHGLHGLRDATNTLLGIFHGELCPTNIVVGKDGVSRLVAVFRPRPVSIKNGSEALRYAAPEALDIGGAHDARADLYAVGVILWEGLTGKRLYTERDPARILQRQREDDVVSPTAFDPAFAKLADVAERALSYDPANRYRSASEMMAEIRRIAGGNLAQGSAVAQKVVELAGERIRARRLELDANATGKRRPSVVAEAPADTTPSPPPTPPAESGSGDIEDRVSAPPPTVRGAIPDGPPSSEKMRASPAKSSPQIRADAKSDPAIAASAPAKKPEQSSPQIRAVAKSDPAIVASAPAKKPEQSSPQIRAVAKSDPAIAASAPAKKPEQSSPQIRAAAKSGPSLTASALAAASAPAKKPEQSSPQIRTDAKAPPRATNAGAAKPQKLEEALASGLPDLLPGTSAALEAASTPPAPAVKKPPPPISRTPAPPAKSLAPVIAIPVSEEEAAPLSSSALVDAPPSDPALVPFGVPIAVIPKTAFATEAARPEQTPPAATVASEREIVAAPVMVVDAVAKPVVKPVAKPIARIDLAPDTVSPPPKKKIAPLAIFTLVFLGVAIVVVFLVIAFQKPPEDLTKELARPPATLTTGAAPTTTTTTTTASAAPSAPAPSAIATDTASAAATAVEPPPSATAPATDTAEPSAAIPSASVAPPPPRPIKRVPYEPLGI